LSVGRSAVKIAEKLGIKQAAVSRLERRAGMSLSPLRELSEAMVIVADQPSRQLRRS
jgi:hypothetical protein